MLTKGNGVVEMHLHEMFSFDDPKFKVKGSELDAEMARAFLNKDKEKFVSLLDEGANIDCFIIKEEKGEENIEGNLLYVLANEKPVEIIRVPRYSPVFSVVSKNKILDEEINEKRAAERRREERITQEYNNENRIKQSKNIISMVDEYLLNGGKHLSVEELKTIQFTNVAQYINKSQFVAKMLIVAGFRKADDFVRNKYEELIKSDLSCSDIIKEIIAINPNSKDILAKKFNSYREYAFDEIKKDKKAFRVLSLLHSDKDFMLNLAKENILTNTGSYITEELKNDKDYLLELAKIKGYNVFEYSTISIRKDKALLYQLYKNGITRLKGSDLTRFIGKEMSILKGLEENRIKLADMDDKLFAEDWFFEETTNIVRDKVLKHFETLTKDLSEEDIVEASIQEDINKKIESFTAKINKKREIAIEETRKLEEEQLKKQDQIKKIKQDIEAFEV